MAFILQSKFHVYAKKISTSIIRHHVQYNIKRLITLNRIHYFLPKTESETPGVSDIRLNENEQYKLIYKIHWGQNLPYLYYFMVFVGTVTSYYFFTNIGKYQNKESSGLLQVFKLYGLFGEEKDVHLVQSIEEDEGTKSQPVFHNLENEEKENVKGKGFSSFDLNNASDPIIVACFILLHLSFLGYFRSRVVLSSYRNGSNYLTYFYQPLSNNMKCIQHKAGDCHFQEDKMLFKYTINKKRVLLFPEHFSSIEEKQMFA